MKGSTSMDNKFENWITPQYIKDTIKNPNIFVGDFSYYSGFYHKENFEDACVRYLLGDESTKSYKELFGKNFEFDKLYIGKFCSIASGVTFLLAGNQGHDTSRISVYPFPKKIFPNSKDGFKRKGDTVLQNDIWVGTEALIMPGIKIGNGAIIASRAVVTKDVPPYSIVGGNPAKIIKYRYSKEEIELLLEIAWWDWPTERINEALKFIQDGDVKNLHEFSFSRDH